MKPAAARHFTKIVISWRTSPQSISTSTSTSTSSTTGDKRPNTEGSPSTPNKKQKSTTNTTLQTSRQKITAPQVTKSPRSGQANKRAGGSGGNNRNNVGGGYVRIAKIARNKSNEKNLYVPPPRRGT
jgi:septal ring-binding cell division protein DamX